VAGCNRYFATIKDGPAPGDVDIGPLGATRMLCPEPQAAVEQRFMQQLADVRGISFMASHLVLAYEKNSSVEAMLFERR
jgi:heat shock protein HslJ